MTRTEFVSMAAERTKMTKKDTDKVLSELLAIMSEALDKGDRVQFVGFGTFEVREKAARTAKNPRTGEPVQSEACSRGCLRSNPASSSRSRSTDGSKLTIRSLNSLAV